MLMTKLKSEEVIGSLASGKVFIINCHGCKEVGFPEEEANALQKKLAVNTTGLLFDLLGRTNSREAITAAVKVHRARGEQILVAAAVPVQPPQQVVQRGADAVPGGGNEDLFATPPVDFDAGVIDAVMLRSRAAYLRALSAAEKLPELTSGDLTAAPGLGQSTAQVLHNVDELAGRQ